MKKILVLMIALLAVTTTVSAQKVSREEQANAMIDMMRMFAPVGKEFAVMTYPVTWRQYRVISGKKLPKGTSIMSVVMLSSPEQKKVADAMTKNDGNGVKYRVATSAELQKALQKRINISSEAGPHTHVTKGFYLAISYNDYLKIQQMLQVIGEGRG